MYILRQLKNNFFQIDKYKFVLYFTVYMITQYILCLSLLFKSNVEIIGSITILLPSTAKWLFQVLI